MTVERVWAAVLGITVLFTGSTMWTQHSVSSQVSVISVPAPQTTAVTDSTPHVLPTRDDFATRDDDWAEPRVDLNGNEIDNAVGDYRIDPRGELYERHAPDTALLHLSAPGI